MIPASTSRRTLLLQSLNLENQIQFFRIPAGQLVPAMDIHWRRHFLFQSTCPDTLFGQIATQLKYFLSHVNHIAQTPSQQILVRSNICYFDFEQSDVLEPFVVLQFTCGITSIYYPFLFVDCQKGLSPRSRAACINFSFSFKLRIPSLRLTSSNPAISFSL